jgi:hypothetical protein
MPWYEYSAVGGDVARPMVELVLWHGARRVRLIALLDSGADSSLMNADYISLLGLDRADAEEGQSIAAGGEPMTCLSWPKANLEIQFEGNRFRFLGEFAEFRHGDDGLNLAGRQDFFSQYVVTFWDAEGLVQIDESPFAARPPIASPTTATRAKRRSRSKAEREG